MNKLPLKAILIAVFCNVLFGSAGPFIKLGFSYFGMGSDAFSNILFAGIRFFCSGLIVLGVDTCRRKAFPKVHPVWKASIDYFMEVAPKPVEMLMDWWLAVTEQVMPTTAERRRYVCV